MPTIPWQRPLLPSPCGLCMLCPAGVRVLRHRSCRLLPPCKRAPGGCHAELGPSRRGIAARMDGAAWGTPGLPLVLPVGRSAPADGRRGPLLAQELFVSRPRVSRHLALELLSGQGPLLVAAAARCVVVLLRDRWGNDSNLLRSRPSKAGGTRCRALPPTPAGARRLIGGPHGCGLIDPLLKCPQKRLQHRPLGGFLAGLSVRAGRRKRRLELLSHPPDLGLHRLDCLDRVFILPLNADCPVLELLQLRPQRLHQLRAGARIRAEDALAPHALHLRLLFGLCLLEALDLLLELTDPMEEGEVCVLLRNKARDDVLWLPLSARSSLQLLKCLLEARHGLARATRLALLGVPERGDGAVEEVARRRAAAPPPEPRPSGKAGHLYLELRLLAVGLGSEGRCLRERLVTRLVGSVAGLDFG
mmetsp:Transcript_1832/g.4319  ORF Transcript_1832/g.4319 Transcript_1832/m.4319 type:complete len:417 (-) Transcript_1832:845-2095(-)